MGGFENMFLGGPGGEARAEAGKYKKVLETLEAKIPELREKISSMERELSGSHESFISNPNAAEGRLNTTFEEHEGYWQEQYRRIIANMEMGVQSLEIRKTAAEQLMKYWEQIASMKETMARGRF